MRRILGLIALSVALSLTATALAFWFSSHRPTHDGTATETPGHDEAVTEPVPEA